MLKVKYVCGLRKQMFEAELSSEKNRLKDLRNNISQKLRVKPQLLSISRNDINLVNQNEIIDSNEFYQVYVMPEVKLFFITISTEGGKFFDCFLEENDLLQDLIEQVDCFLTQVLKEQFKTYNLFLISNMQLGEQINYQDNRKSVIGDLFNETTVKIQIRLVHEVLTLKLLDTNDNNNCKDIEINRNKTLLDLKELIQPNLQNFQMLINGKQPYQNFDARLVKDVFQHYDTICIVQVQELEK